MSPNFEQLRKLVLRCGSVFYGHIPGVVSEKRHYIFLLNENAREDADYALVVASSKVEKVDYMRKIFGYDTIAEIPPGTEPFLDKPTFVNCNDVKLINIRFIKGKFDCGDLKCLNETLSKPTLINIINCVKNSRTISEEIKSFLPKSI